MVWLLILVGVALVVAVVAIAARLMLPAVSEASERVRIQRETQEASWRLHQHAAHAFAEMLAASRRTDVEDES
jgi:type II secretory pathway pseudopilin PulG